VRLIFFLILLFTVLIYALWKGGAPERWIAVQLIVAMIASLAVVSGGDAAFRTIEIETAIVDSILFAGMLVVALHADRYWTLWITAFQLIQVLAHLPEILVPQLLPEVYGLIISVWSYPMLLLLFAGTYRHQQRVMRFGNDKSWSNFSQQPV
jgi:hypothetical protein